MVHGSTLVTNALIERKGARAALIVTVGTRDVIEIGREVRYDLYDLDLELPTPLVPPALRFEIQERIAAGVPVVTSNQATLWAALRHMGVAMRNPAAGRLFETGAPLAA